MSFCTWENSEKYRDHFENGVYVCSDCGYELFSSKVKFQHGSPWPAFTSPMHADSLYKYEESPNVLKVLCGKCKNGLGHEFIGDGPKEGQSRF